MLHDKQLFKKVPFQSTKYRKKEFCVDNIKNFGDVYCPTCRNEKCVYVSTNKTTSFYDCKIAKPAATFWMLLLRTKNRQLCCLVVTVLTVLQKRAVATTKKKNHLFFEEISLRVTTKHFRTWTKKRQIKFKYGINVCVSYWLMVWATYSFSNQFNQFQSTVNLHPTYTKSSWLSQSPTTEFSGLSILVPTLLLLQ